MLLASWKNGFARLSALCLLTLTAALLMLLSQHSPATELPPPPTPLNSKAAPLRQTESLRPDSPVTVRILFPTTTDNPVTGGIVPLVVEVRERVSERGVFWTERLLVGVEDQVPLDSTQLSGEEYDSATQEMVYRVLTPWWTLGLPEMDTFLWTQAQWVGVPLGEQNAPDYREGETTDAVDIKVDNRGNLLRVGRT